MVVVVVCVCGGGGGGEEGGGGREGGGLGLGLVGPNLASCTRVLATSQLPLPLRRDMATNDLRCLGRSHSQYLDVWC